MALPFFALTLPKSHPFVNDFGMGAAYSGTQSASATSVLLTVNRDGTWAITFGTGDTAVGSPTSGSWAASPSTIVGDSFEVQFTIANGVGSPTINNGASSFTAITSGRTIEVTKTNADASADVTVIIREAGFTVPTLTDTANFAANGAP